MQALRLAIRRELRLKLLCAIALLLAGGLLSYFFFSENVVVAVIGLVGVVLGIRYTYKYIHLWHEDDAPLMRLLQLEADKIVWVYSVVTHRLPFGLAINQSGTLYFKLIDGDEQSVSLPIKDLKPISEMLNRLLPHATFGYSPDKEQLYMAAPEMLLRYEED